MQHPRIGNAQHYLLKRILLTILVGMGLANWSAILYAQDNVDAAEKASQQVGRNELRIVPLGGGTYMFSGDGGNVVVVVDDVETLVIDSGIESGVSELYQAIFQASHRPVTHLVNTSGNAERTGGNTFFSAAGVTIIAQQNVKKQLSSRWRKDSAGLPEDESLEEGLPQLTYTDNLTLQQGLQNLRLVHYGQGSSDGDTIVYFDSANVVVMGDIFSNASYPLVDVASGGSVGGIIETVNQVLAATNNNTRIIPGSGPIATRAELRAYRDMLVTVQQRIRTLISQGKTMSQIVAEDPTKDFDSQWGTGDVPANVFTTVVYSQTVEGLNVAQ